MTGTPPVIVSSSADAVARKVLVAGATGRVGRFVVQKLLEMKTPVRALVREQKRAMEILGSDVELVAGDTRDVESVRSAVAGVDAVVCCTGARPQGPPGAGGVTWAAGNPEQVDYAGVRNLATALAANHPSLTTSPIISFDTVAPDFVPVNDAVMGGLSTSSLVASGSGTAVFAGNVSLDNNGGFSSVKTAGNQVYDLSAYTGLQLRVKGDGKRYKLAIKTADDTQSQVRFVTSFATVAGRWTEVYLPFDQFKPCVRNKVVYGSGPGVYGLRFDTSSILEFGLLLSRFEFDGLPNPQFAPGPFALELQYIAPYTAPMFPPLPRFVLLSSAGVLRPGRLAMGSNAPENMIPIVQLSPSIGDILKWKLAGEDAVRESGLPYSIVRAVGLVEGADTPGGAVQFVQGDHVVGQLSRFNTAQVLIAALNSRSASYKTFEALEPPSGFSSTSFERQFAALLPDSA